MKKINPFAYNKRDFVDSDMIDKISLWMLRILVELGGIKEFIKYEGFADDDIAYFLDLGDFVTMDKISKNKILNILQNKLNSYANIDLKTDTTLQKNIDKLSKLITLDEDEKSVLEFRIAVENYEILKKTTEYLQKINARKLKKTLSVILKIKESKIEKIFYPNSIFSTSSILKIDSIYINDTLSNLLDLINDQFAFDMINHQGDIKNIFSDVIKEVKPSKLTLQNYDHLKNDVKIIKKILQNSIQKKEIGVNILLYGVPGTGKSELAKVLSTEIDTKLYEISSCDKDRDSMDGASRIKSYKIAQTLFKKSPSLILYDEAEDIFDKSNLQPFKSRQNNKAWLNKILESNPSPTIWITNNIYSVDDAIIRRFNYSLKLPIPKRKKRKEIIKLYSKGLLDEKIVKKLSKNPNISPAVIENAIKVAKQMPKEEFSKTIIKVAKSTIKAQGYIEYKKIKDKNPTLPKNYDPSIINTTTDLKKLAKGIVQNPNARLCLYGVAGTGKSAYGLYIAKILGKKAILKKGSDLISMWVGGTEKNIADAFKEAKKKKAILIFDEVDSFLADRRSAQRSWEVTQVNEMLTQMESFKGIFIATTNLMDNLDQASLRRFDLKMEFGYLKDEQALKLFRSYLKEFGFRLQRGVSKDLKLLRYLTPGDFTAVSRQHRFSPIKDSIDFYQRLRDEVAIKEVSEEGGVMGFVGS